MFKSKSIFLLFITLVFLIPNQKLMAQDQHPAFIDHVIPVVKIDIDSDSLDAILDTLNLQSNHEFPARFIFENGSLLDTVENVGFRLRGNTSRFSQKKSFKVSFNSFESGRKYYGLEKLNLNGEHNDPSIIRSKLCWDLFKSLQIKSPRANHVELYINEKYYGLYINVEHIDENFVRDRFGNNDGNLFKCLWPADLGYLGEDADLYKLTNGDRQAYALKTNREEDDYTDLAELISRLEFTPSATFTAFENIFNVDGFLRILAVDVATGSWDDYWYLKNNYYLYNNPETAVFEFIPYDYDNTFGIDWVGQDWGNRDIYNWGHDTEIRPLVTKILSVQEYRDRYSYYLNKLLHGDFHPDVLFPKIDLIHDMISEAAAQDTFRTLDWDFSYEDFNNSYDQELGGHVEYGLKPYVIQRRNSALEQLQLNNIMPVVKNLEYFPRVIQADQLVDVSIYIEDDDPDPSVQLYHSVNGGNWVAVTMFDDGLNGDEQSEDLIYGGQIPPPGVDGTIQFYISAVDANTNTSLFPRKAPQSYFSIQVGYGTPELYLNEFMASNDSTISDELGEYDDWVEIYNGGNSLISLRGMFLTDNLSNPDKWPLPNAILRAGAYLLIWVDNDAEQGPLHANFRLDRDGEQLGLFRDEADGIVPVDTFSFDLQPTDISFGRTVDGDAHWQYFNNPTPGATNISTHITQGIKQIPQEFSLEQNFPNPFNSRTIISFHLPSTSRVRLDVFNYLGQIIETLADGNFDQGIHQLSLETNSWSSGIYFYKIAAKSKEGQVFLQIRKSILIK